MSSIAGLDDTFSRSPIRRAGRFSRGWRQPAITKHLQVLERAGLVSASREGRRRRRRLEPAPLAGATAWLEAYREVWESNFRRLDALLDELQAKGGNRETTK